MMSKTLLVVGVKIGIIGIGRMGFSLAKGLLASGTKSNNIRVSDKSSERLNVASRELRVKETSSNRELVTKSDLVFLAVKPNDVEGVLDEIRDALGRKLFISFAAGVPIKSIEKGLGEKAKVIRVMPNISCSVLEGVLAYSSGERITARDENIVKGLLGKLGLVAKVDEHKLDAITGLSGSGPAYLSLVIEALAQAGVEEGLPRGLAVKLAAQTAKGVGELVLKSGKAPAELIEMVRSPKGTTVEGLRVLEERRVAEAVMEAVKATVKRSKELSR